MSFFAYNSEPYIKETSTQRMIDSIAVAYSLVLAILLAATMIMAYVRCETPVIQSAPA